MAITLPAAQTRTKAPLGPGDIDAIATLLMLEDARTFDEAQLRKIAASPHPEVRRRAIQSVGRIADKAGAPLIEAARQDQDVEVAATAVWAAGQLRDPAAIEWLGRTLSAPKTPEPLAREAAIALGKIQSPDARAALAQYLSAATTGTPASVLGEALLSIGRFPAGGDLSPILKWTASKDVEIRWRAAWALFRPRDPAAASELLRLSADPSADVRFWAVRGLIPHPNTDPAPAAARLRDAVRDPDRRVRTEALRTLATHDDEASLKIIVDMLDADDSWLSVSAAEAMARHEPRAAAVVPRLVAAAAVGRPVALRVTARQSLSRLGEAGKGALAGLSTEGLPPAQAAGPRGPRPVPQLRTLPEYRQVVARWVVPAYNGDPAPRATWETPRGTIELELYPGDAPLGVDYLVRATDAGDIAGTEFTRLVPNFVAQQRAIRNAALLRDEVSRRGLTRGNLSWASAGLDTGRPGYTLGVTPQPHNEGNFTALGRVVRGMDVLERLELGDAVTAARIGGGQQAARPMRTEAEARARADANRRDREQQRLKTGAPVELISDYAKANIGPVPQSLGVSPFYKKYADALGIPVIASEKVPDAALLVARDIVNTMLSARPDLRKALIGRGWRTGVIAEVEMTMDIPEYSKMKRPGASRDEPVTQEDRDYHANRSRGLGGNPTTGAEENLLGYPGTRYWGEHIFVHEFAHAIMGGGIREVDPTMFAEIRTAYDSAMAAGKYVHADGRKHYATTNAGEYWAEGVQWWFFSNYGECFVGNVKVETPEEFAAYDPALNELIGRVFTTHRIPMDVFHGKRIRPVTCGSASNNDVRQ